MLAIDQLTVAYPGQNRPALNRLRLAIDGSACILGPSGAGKSTLLKTLMGLVPAIQGTLAMDGISLVNRPLRARARMAYIPQENSLPRESTLGEYLMELTRLDHFPSQRQGQAVKEILELVHLSPAAHKRMKWLSGGMKRRALIAGALLRNTSWLLMDEPTLGLDPDEQASIRSLIRNLCRHRHVILATQFVEDAAAISHRIIILQGGQVVAETHWQALADMAYGHLFMRPAQEAAQSPTLFWAPMAGGDQVRAFTAEPPPEWTHPLQPSVEDGYLWLIKTGGVVARE